MIVCVTSQNFRCIIPPDYDYIKALVLSYKTTSGSSNGIHLNCNKTEREGGSKSAKSLSHPNNKTTSSKLMAKQTISVYFTTK